MEEEPEALENHMVYAVYLEIYGRVRSGAVLTQQDFERREVAEIAVMTLAVSDARREEPPRGFVSLVRSINELVGEEVYNAATTS